MTDLSGITVTAGILPPQQKDALAAALDRIGGKLIDSVRIDTTHFVCTEGRGPLWEKAVEMNIPVVVPEWVDACEAEGTIVSVRGYYLNADPKARQLGPIHSSTQHQRTVSTATSNLAPPAAQAQTSSRQTGQEDEQNLEPPVTPFPGAEMTGQPIAEEKEVGSDESTESPPPPPPKDEEEDETAEQNGDHETPPPPPEKDESESEGEGKDEEEKTEEDTQEPAEEEKEKDDSSNAKERKSKEGGEGDFNEVPL